MSSGTISQPPYPSVALGESVAWFASVSRPDTLAPPPPPPFSPTDIPGLIFWLDTTDPTTITLDGSGNIVTIVDKAQGVILTQTNPALRPHYDPADSVVACPYMTFSNSEFTFVTPYDIESNDTSFYSFASDNLSIGNALVTLSNGSSVIAGALQINASLTQFLNYNTIGQVCNTTTATLGTDVHVLSVDQSASPDTFVLDGVVIPPVTNVSHVTGAVTTFGNYGGFQAFSKVGPVIVYRGTGLTAGQIAQVTAYLDNLVKP